MTNILILNIYQSLSSHPLYMNVKLFSITTTSQLNYNNIIYLYKGTLTFQEASYVDLFIRGNFIDVSIVY